MKSGNSWATVLVHSIPMKTRNSLARDVLDTFATHADFLQDLTDSDCHTHNGSAGGRDCRQDF